MGVGGALLTKYKFESQNIGGPFQFVWTFGVTSRFAGPFGAGYHFQHFSDAGMFLPIHHANWMNYASKAVWLKEARSKITEDRAVFWIDDEAEPVDGVIELKVDRVGERELESVRQRLSALLANKQRLVA
jgi:hypothetical protein